jgi:hypothetical protein
MNLILGCFVSQRRLWLGRDKFALPLQVQSAIVRGEAGWRTTRRLGASLLN